MLLYALTTVVSAFLLFQVQPIIAKIICRGLAGRGVWTVCLLFFQMVLLLGYLYAHTCAVFEAAAQMMLHGCLLVVSAVALPIYPAVRLKPAGGADPTREFWAAGADGGTAVLHACHDQPSAAGMVLKAV